MTKMPDVKEIRQEQAEVIYALDGEYAYEPFHNCVDAKSRSYTLTSTLPGKDVLEQAYAALEIVWETNCGHESVEKALAALKPYVKPK